MVKRLVSGIKPTGELHLGNYLGAIKQWVELQQDYDCFFFVADYHALTTKPEPDRLRQDTLSTLAMLVALGVDPRGSVLFLQSDIPEQAELAWLLLNFTSVGALGRMTQYKEKSDRLGQNAGLFGYPVLMASDVLTYDAEAVPVGEDQIQHLELAREIARSFNSHAGKIFKQPRPILNEGARIMSLSNPAQKMSKSIPGSAIGLLDDEDEVVRTIKKAVTQTSPGRANEGVKNLLRIMEGLSSPETFLHFRDQQRHGTIRYSELKDQLIEDVLDFLGPVQKAYHGLNGDPEKLRKIFARGAEAARPLAQQKLTQVKNALGLVD